MRYLYKKAFLKAFDGAQPGLQNLITTTDREIKKYLESGHATYGLRVKKLGQRSFEGRVSDRVRIVWVREGDIVSFAMVGNHSEVQHYLKNY